MVGEAGYVAVGKAGLARLLLTWSSYSAGTGPFREWKPLTTDLWLVQSAKLGSLWLCFHNTASPRPSFIPQTYKSVRGCYIAQEVFRGRKDFVFVYRFFQSITNLTSPYRQSLYCLENLHNRSSRAGRQRLSPS